MSPPVVIRRDEAITEFLPQASVLRRNRRTQDVAPAFPALPLVSAVTDLAAPQDDQHERPGDGGARFLRPGNAETLGQDARSS